MNTTAAPARPATHDGPAKVAVIIPAHNEEKGIAQTIESVLAQTRVPDTILVVAHNCIDKTAEIARRYPVIVHELNLDNGERKTAPLNYGMNRLLAVLDEQDFILTVDGGDTWLHPELVARALAHFDRVPRLGAAGAHHLVDKPEGLLERLQQMEMERGMRSANRRGGRRTCMSGMCSMFRVRALHDVLGEYGRIYEPWNSTESWQLTFAIRMLGWIDRRPRDMYVRYAPVTTWKALLQQRERWGRGYWQTLCHFGIRHFTIWPWILQAWWVFSTAVFFLFAVLEGQQHHMRITPWLAVVTVVMLVTSVVTVHKIGFKAMLTAALVIPEQGYIWVINFATMLGIGKQLLRMDMQWADVREK